MDDHDELSLAYADVGDGHGLLVRFEGEALTKCFHRTEETIGVASRADCGSEIHERLVEIVSPSARDQRFGKVPEGGFLHFGMTGGNKYAMQHADDVSV